MTAIVWLLCVGAWAQAAPRPFQPLSLVGARAVWASRGELRYTPRAGSSAEGLRFQALQVETGQTWDFTPSPRGGLRFAREPADLGAWLREPTVFLVTDGAGREVDRTYFQTALLLDDLYHYDGCLGVCWEGGDPVLRVWAPTARAVKVKWVSGGEHPTEENSVAMQPGPEGTFFLRGDGSWLNRHYLLSVEVFSPLTGKMEVFSVTDPYSVGLAPNASSSVVLNLESEDWQPSGWSETPRPRLASRSDAVVYELHVRDFSSADFSVPAEFRGTYHAFALSGTRGDQELRTLAAAGVTHVHLLPVFDFASVDENPLNRREPQVSPGLPPDSPLPQESVSRYRTVDSFNWGYDPYHFLAPEGSYARQPDGGPRVREFREMVQALHERGLRVVMDVVFNHTYAAGLADESVLDKVVPGYYYRLDADGQAKNSSCCADTASEHRMMAKLMLDSLELWRTQYKIDGFRFDLMNLHSVETMAAIRDRLRAEDDSILLYGEAWPFGSLFDVDPGHAFTQGNAYGQGIGVFNDRLRDALRGGTTDSREKSDPGFVTGLFYDFNQEPANRNTPPDLDEQREKLLWLGDVVRVGLAGNLRDYSFPDHRGNLITGGELRYHDGPTAFAENPEETISYVSAHDGYTLWDALAAKLPFRTRGREPETAPVRERVERQLLALGVVAFSQGIPFFDEGSELLRSKGGDQNSYDSGDWFNAVDWSEATNGWGRGLPPTFSNPNDAPFWRPRLADPALTPTSADIEYCRQNFLAMLKLRASSPLFRLRAGREVQSRVRFLETELGAGEPPGVIVMELADEDADGRDLDPHWRRLLVAVNATNGAATFEHASLARAPLERLYGTGESHPALSLPPRSITVWGERP